MDGESIPSEYRWWQQCGGVRLWYVWTGDMHFHVGQVALKPAAAHRGNFTPKLGLLHIKLFSLKVNRFFVESKLKQCLQYDSFFGAGEDKYRNSSSEITGNDNKNQVLLYSQSWTYNNVMLRPLISITCFWNNKQVLLELLISLRINTLICSVRLLMFRLGNTFCLYT